MHPRLTDPLKSVEYLSHNLLLAKYFPYLSDRKSVPLKHKFIDAAAIVYRNHVFYL